MAHQAKKAYRSKAGKFPYLVPAVDRALDILALLRAEAREMTLAELAKSTGWHKSSLQRILLTLQHHGFLERDEATKKYSLGMRLADYGRIALENMDLRKPAKPFLKALVDFSGETAVLAVLNGTKMVIIDKREPVNQIRVSPYIGLQYPATPSSNGKALLAWLPEGRVHEILQIEGLPALTRKSIVDRKAYWAELAATRQRGFALDREECQEGLSGVSAPVFNPRGQVIATLSVAGPAFRMTESSLRKCGEKCVELADELSKQLR
jgi:DNA-binding IclR family transcriptional regulator